MNEAKNDILMLDKVLACLRGGKKTASRYPVHLFVGLPDAPR